MADDRYLADIIFSYLAVAQTKYIKGINLQINKQCADLTPPGNNPCLTNLKVEKSVTNL